MAPCVDYRFDQPCERWQEARNSAALTSDSPTSIRLNAASFPSKAPIFKLKSALGRTSDQKRVLRSVSHAGDASTKIASRFLSKPDRIITPITTSEAPIASFAP
jgi:hypothetical protein